MEVCRDHSLWKNEPNICINKTLLWQVPFYMYVPLCNRDRFNCSTSQFPEHCPNSSDFETCHQLEKSFFCDLSKTCIPYGNRKIYSSFCQKAKLQRQLFPL